MKYVDEANMEKFTKIDTTSWDTVKDNVYIRLMNAKYIGKYDSDIVHTNFLDLIITFSIREKGDGIIKSHILTNDDLKQWNVDQEEVSKVAFDNSLHDRKKRIMTFKEHVMKDSPMYPILRIPQGMSIGASAGDSSSSCGVIRDVDDETSKNNILIICNKNDAFGASYMAIPEVLEEVHERFDNEDFYIIPLSVHQVMCIRNSYATFNKTKPIHEVEDDLLDMIEDFNDANNSSWQNILSYKIYYYFGNDGKKLFLIK